MKLKHMFFTSMSIAIFSSSCFATGNVILSNESSHNFSTTAIPFIQNQGQKNPDVAYYARTLGGAVFVNKQGELVYSLPKKTDKGIEGWAFKETFIGDGKLNPKSVSESPTRLSYMHSKQIQSAQTANALSLGQAVSGVEIQLQASNNNVEKLFIVAPGADTSNIKVKLDGVNGSHIDQMGQLVLETSLGPIEFTKPVAFQMKGDQKQLVQVAYTLKDNQYGFTLGAYDKSQQVIIDPLLASTFVGGSNSAGSYDRVHSVLSDGDYVYVGGMTQSADFPTALGYDSTFAGPVNGFVLCFSKDLKTLVNGSFIGSVVYSLAKDSDGSIVAAGQTNGGFPITAGAYSYPWDYDRIGGFIAKMSNDLSSLIAGGVVTKTFISKMTIGNGAIYFGGSTNNPSFEVTPGVVGPECNCSLYPGQIGPAPYRGFIGRVTADLSNLEVLSYLGGTAITGIAVAADSSVYVSDGNPAALRGSLSRLDSDITAFLGTSNFGLTSITNFYDVAVKGNSVYAVGETKKSDLPVTSGAFDTSCGSDGNCNTSLSDGFVVKYNTSLDTIEALSYIGGNSNDGARALAIDNAGSIYVAGETTSPDFKTTSGAFDTSCGRDGKCDQTGTYGVRKEAFISKLSGDLSKLEYSSFIGGSHNEFVNDLELESTGIAFLAGETDWASNFPTTSGAFDTSFNGGASDGFVSKFDTGAGTGGGGGGSNAAPIANAGSDQTVSSKSSVTLNGSGSSDSDGNIASYNWKQVSGSNVNISNANSSMAKFTAPSVKRGKTITLVFELSVTDDKGATGKDQVTVTVK